MTHDPNGAAERICAPAIPPILADIKFDPLIAWRNHAFFLTGSKNEVTNWRFAKRERVPLIKIGGKNMIRRSDFVALAERLAQRRAA